MNIVLRIMSANNGRHDTFLLSNMKVILKHYYDPKLDSTSL